MKTISLNRVMNTLSDSEMKMVKGGLDKITLAGDPKHIGDDEELTPKQEACKFPKKEGDECEWQDSAGVWHYGHCVFFFGQKHCSDLN